MTRQSTYFIQIALLTVVLFCASTIIMLRQFRPELFQEIKQTEVQEFDLSGYVVDAPAGQVNPTNFAFSVYETASQSVGDGVKKLGGVFDILKQEGAIGHEGKVILLLMVPYFVALAIILLVSNSISYVRLLITSIVTSTIIGFTIIYVALFYQVNTGAATTSTEMLVSYALLNSFMFFAVYFLISSVFGRFSE